MNGDKLAELTQEMAAMWIVGKSSTMSSPVRNIAVGIRILWIVATFRLLLVHYPQYIQNQYHCKYLKLFIILFFPCYPAIRV